MWLNCTFMELKDRQSLFKIILRYWLNCTFMELKEQTKQEDNG